MSLVLLDTTFLIDAERGRLELEATIEDDADVAVAAISVAEILVGVELASAERRHGREAFVGDVVSSIPVVPYDIRVAKEHAGLLASVRSAGRPRGAHDLIIAATARATSREVITSDPQAFQGLPGVVFSTYR